MALSQSNRLFVEAYDGDELYAMRVAGFTGGDSELRARAKTLLKDPKIIQAIQDRSKYLATTQKVVADRQERQALWTQIMRNSDPHRKEETDSNGVPIPEGNIPLPIRLKASELLGKSEADFIDKVDMTSNITITDIISQSYQTDDDIDSIEAEYNILKDRKQLANLEDSIIEDPETSPTPPTPDLEDFV